MGETRNWPLLWRSSTGPSEVVEERPLWRARPGSARPGSSKRPLRPLNGKGSRSTTAAASTMQYRAVDAFLELVEHLCVTRPIALALENLHWAEGVGQGAGRRRKARQGRFTGTRCPRPCNGPAYGQRKSSSTPSTRPRSTSSSELVAQRAHVHRGQVVCSGTRDQPEGRRKGAVDGSRSAPLDGFRR